MNYKKYAQEHQKDMKYKIIEINDTYVTLQCKICSAIKRVQLKSLYRNDMQIHSQSCCKYFLDICREEIGEKEAKNSTIAIDVPTSVASILIAKTSKNIKGNSTLQILRSITTLATMLIKKLSRIFRGKG